jgi:predicted unusual protein kinase regulating ubiquinone biosynthesis (AarF/ABC1/UbiB family)
MATTASSRPLGGGRIGRSLRPARLVGRAALRWASTYLAFGERRQNKRQQFVLRTAEDVTRTMGDMKGAVMKFGQILSMMTGFVPDELAAQLASLQSDAPPMAYELVERVIEQELGAPPGQVFRRFERQPFAAASIGQVHRARLRDGTDVAVKVQYPGVREAIAHDLANVAMLVGMAGVVSPGLDAGPIIRDLKDGILGELDYRREAANQRRFYDEFRGHAFIRIPQVFDDYSTDRVLTQELLRGKPFAAALEWPDAERQRLGEIIFRYAFGSIYRHRLFNGDPHPGNYVVLGDGAVGFVDYGCVAEFTPEMIAGFVRVIHALLSGDHEGWRAAVEDIGILRRDAPFTTEQLWEHMHWYWAPILEPEVTFTPELAGEMIRRNTQTTGEGGRINKYCNVPPGMVFLTRINFGLAGVLSELRTRGPWRDIIREYIDGIPPVTELGRLSAATSHGASV